MGRLERGVVLGVMLIGLLMVGTLSLETVKAGGAGASISKPSSPYPFG